MRNISWIEEIDREIEAGVAVEQRNLNKREQKRMDYLSKLAQSQAAEVDLLIAESYLDHKKQPNTLKTDELSDDEQAAITSAKNAFELTNARLKCIVSLFRRDCGMPYHAKLRGFVWYDDSSGKPVPFVVD